MNEVYFLFLIAVVAFLYASVGHGGASGYLALMVLYGISPAEMKTSALILNLFVSSIAFVQYYRKGFFKMQMLLPFILLSIPMAFIGAKIHIEKQLYKIILAGCLLIAVARILGLFTTNDSSQTQTIKFFPALIIGAVLGFVSGMIGIGGGILLSPVVILLRWATIKQSAALAAAFIFLNSIAGLAGAFNGGTHVSSDIYVWAIVAIIGGTAGAFMGSHRFNNLVLKYILSLVLLFACLKLIIA